MTSKLSNKVIRWAIAASFFAVGSVGAQTALLSDLENGSNQNEFGYYWYLYDDSKDGGNTTIPNMTKNPDGTYMFKPTASEGNTGGTPGFGAKVDFKLGTVKPGNTSAKWGNMVGVGTMLAADKEYMDLTGATKIEFYAKVKGPAAVTGVELRVEVCTQELETDYGFYHIVIPITTSWAKYTIPLTTTDVGFGKLEQWDWSVSGGGAKPFNIKKVSKIQWCISEDGNVSGWADAAGTLWLDDISITPFTVHLRDDIETSALGAPGATGLDAKAKLADMEKTQNAAKFYTYCYTDGAANPDPTKASTITEGATLNTTTNTYTLTLSDGGVAASKCALIKFELGTAYTSGTNTINPFVGIGTNLCDDPLNTVFTDLSAGTAIYFDYKLQSDKIKFVTLEVKTNQTFGTNADAVYYVKLPATNGEWKGATVDLKATPAELVLPQWDGVSQTIPLDLKQSMKFQWKVQGAPRSTGTLGIDNVYVVGKDFTGIRHGKIVKGATPDFIIRQTAAAANVSFVMPQQFSAATLELVSIQGKVLASQSVKSMGKTQVQASFPISGLASGSYLVRLSSNGEFVKSAMISIAK